jgi:hypothetical protein
MRPVVVALALFGALALPPAAPAQTAPKAQVAEGLDQETARQRVEAAGYTAVQDLRQDATGFWRGTAMREGTRLNVAVAPDGNIVAGPGALGVGGTAAVPPGTAPNVGADPPGLVGPPSGGGGR